MDSKDIQQMDDEGLVRAAREAGPGDARAFTELVRRHEGHVRANCRYLVSSHAEAEDLAQEVFVKAYFHLGRFEGRAEFGTWVRRIKVNHCLNHLEARARRTFVDVDDRALAAAPVLTADASAHRAVEHRELKARVDAVLSGLQDTLRIPLVLRDMDGLSYDEIARDLGIGLSAVKMRIKRGREAFREAWLARSGGDDA